jgi:hypothetical protein
VRLLRATIVAGASLWYLGSIFQVFTGAFWHSGLGDWIDPYFINFLLEHWYSSVVHLTDPLSPPFFFPARGTLAYSHGLILYAPIYVALRFVLHPFQAYNLTLLTVVAAGIICLYVIFRKFAGLSFVESGVLTAFFATSANIMNGFLGVWSQRGSVFLIPPILLLTLWSRRLRTPLAPLATASLAGLLTLLLFTQDFLTAQLALLIVLLGALSWGAIEHHAVACTFGRWWAAFGSRSARASGAIAALGAAWATQVVLTGGFTLTLGALTFASHDWRRPALVALLALVFFAWQSRAWTRWRPQTANARWALAYSLGALAGATLFFWIYLDVYREHPTFPDSELTRNLANGYPYEGRRSFAFAFVAAAFPWIPAARIDRTQRGQWLALAIVSFVVLILPITFRGFSIWRAVFEPVPGFAAIRDPKRIISLYELGLVLAVGWMLSRAAMRTRAVVVTLLVVLLLTEQHRLVFDFSRPNQTFDQVVAAPVTIDPACRSFFIAPAPSQYLTRAADPRAVYATDAAFIAVTHGIPTMNGYSAWAPPAWNLTDPEHPAYRPLVDSWIARNNLRGVCELDMESRVMRPYRPIQ